MTGFITTFQGTSSAVAVGDPIALTVQYDPTTPAGSASPGSPFPPTGGITYALNAPVISNLIDVSSGNALFTPGATNLQSSLWLRSVGLPGRRFENTFAASDMQVVPGLAPPTNMVYQTVLFLGRVARLHH